MLRLIDIDGYEANRNYYRIIRIPDNKFNPFIDNLEDSFRY